MHILNTIPEGPEQVLVLSLPLHNKVYQSICKISFPTQREKNIYIFFFTLLQLFLVDVFPLQIFGDMRVK